MKDTMSNMKKRFTTMGFTLRKTYRKLTTAKPSVFIIAAIIAGASIFFLGGGVYDILEKPLIAIPIGRTVLFFYPGTVQEQTILDSLFVMISYSFGLIGLLMVYQSTRYAYRPRQAFILLLIGAMFILIAYYNIENLIYSKLTAGRS